MAYGKFHTYKGLTSTNFSQQNNKIDTEKTTNRYDTNVLTHFRVTHNRQKLSIKYG